MKNHPPQNAVCIAALFILLASGWSAGDQGTSFSYKGRLSDHTRPAIGTQRASRRTCRTSITHCCNVPSPGSKSPRGSSRTTPCTRIGSGCAGSSLTNRAAGCVCHAAIRHTPRQAQPISNAQSPRRRRDRQRHAAAKLTAPALIAPRTGVGMPACQRMPMKNARVIGTSGISA